MPTERFRRYTLPGRIKPLDERRHEPRQPLTTLPSWVDVIGSIEQSISDQTDWKNIQLQKTLVEHRPLILKLYNAYFNIAAGRGRNKLNSLIRQYGKNTKSPNYNPDALEEVKPIRDMIRYRFQKG